MGSFTNSNLTDRGTNQDFSLEVAYERWSLRGFPLHSKWHHTGVILHKLTATELTKRNDINDS